MSFCAVTKEDLKDLATLKDIQELEKKITGNVHGAPPPRKMPQEDKKFSENLIAYIKKTEPYKYSYYLNQLNKLEKNGCDTKDGLFQELNKELKLEKPNCNTFKEKILSDSRNQTLPSMDRMEEILNFLYGSHSTNQSDLGIIYKQTAEIIELLKNRNGPINGGSPPDASLLNKIESISKQLEQKFFYIRIYHSILGNFESCSIELSNEQKKSIISASEYISKKPIVTLNKIIVYGQADIRPINGKCPNGISTNSNLSQQRAEVTKKFLVSTLKEKGISSKITISLTSEMPSHSDFPERDRTVLLISEWHLK